MPTMKMSAHIRAVLEQLERVQPMNTDERITAGYKLYRLFTAIQQGKEIVAPLYPETDRATALVEAYRKTLKPSDILDDDPGPFRMGV
jgi:hypothetical protein